MNYFVADPHWGWEIVAYFFLGGIAAGAYFLAVLIEWFGSKVDEPVAGIAYRIAFPLISVCGVLLIVDLTRPQRFWHMLLRAEVVYQALDAGFPWTAPGWGLMVTAPNLKYWSPMSAGSWGLTVFGGCAFLSFAAAVWPAARPSRLLHRRWPRRALQAVGGAAALFVASYTGALLSATNQPLWSDTVWLAPLFLASSVSTGLATLSLLADGFRVGTPTARARLAKAEPLAVGLEVVVLGAFVASLGPHLGAVLMTVRGNVLIFGPLTFAVLLPLLLRWAVGPARGWGVPAVALCALVGGLLLRYGAVTTPGELLRRGPVAAAVAPEPPGKLAE